MNKKKVVIIGHGFTSRLAVIRSVAQIGCEVTVIVMTQFKKGGKTLRTKKPIDCYSKYVSHIFYCLASDEEALINLLLENCKDRQQKVVIIPDSDFSAATIDKYQERLKDYFLFPHIHHTPGEIAVWMQKPKQKDLAQKIGLNVVNGNVVSITNHHYVIPNDVKYPCFTKPFATKIGGKRLFRKCENETTLREALDYAGNLHENIQLLIEEYKHIDKEYAVVGFSDGKEVIIPGIIQMIAMAHGGHFGVTCQGKIMPTKGFEELISKFKTMVLEIGFVGLFDIDFYESNDKLYFCELNLRFGGSGYALTKMGVNLPGMMVKALYGENTDNMQKCILDEAIFANERMCLDDWYMSFITDKVFHQIMKSSDIYFIKDNSDEGPQKAFKREYFRILAKRFLKRMLRKNEKNRC